MQRDLLGSKKLRHHTTASLKGKQSDDADKAQKVKLNITILALLAGQLGIITAPKEPYPPKTSPKPVAVESRSREHDFQSQLHQPGGFLLANSMLIIFFLF